ncbi:MAG: hypothetical protein AAB442_01450 [Patescibacteria group bacterium]
MTKYLIGVILLISGGYGVFKAWPLLAGPSLSISTPEEFAEVTGSIVTVSGVAARITRLALNGLPLGYDQQGYFSSTLTFPQGGSILTVEAEDRFGRSVTLTRTIFVPYAY